VGKANIKVYNISKTTSEKLMAEGNIAILRVGYEDEGIQTIFYGTVMMPIWRREGTETILEFTAMDGLNDQTEVKVSLCYSANTPAQTVFADLISKIGLPYKPSIQIDKSYVSGYSFIGRAKDALREVLAFAGKTYNIQNNTIVILGDSGNSETTSIYISRLSGLIGTVQVIADNFSQNPDIPMPKRYRFKCLLFPQLLPGSQIQLFSETVKGYFTIEACHMVGDNWENDFQAEVDVRSE
jgi:hypothetical protein